MKKIFKPICYICGYDLSDSPEIQKEIEAKKQTHAIVLPTCKSRQCGDFKCERKRPIKRSAQGAAAKPAKRRKRGADGGQ